MSKTDTILHQACLDGDFEHNELEWSEGMEDVSSYHEWGKDEDVDMEVWKTLTTEQKIALGASPEMVRACESFIADMDAEDEMRRKLASIPLHQIFIPAGWTIWMCCNSPGRIYVGPENAYIHMDGCGSMPVKLEWPVALAYLNNSTEEDPWGLDILANWEKGE